MKVETKKIIRRINEILKISLVYKDGFSPVNLEKKILGTLSVLDATYGANSKQSNQLVAYKERTIGTVDFNSKLHNARELDSYIIGVLETLKSDLKNGFVGSIKTIIYGEIYGDMLLLSKTLLEAT